MGFLSTETKLKIKYPHHLAPSHRRSKPIDILEPLGDEKIEILLQEMFTLPADSYKVCAFLLHHTFGHHKRETTWSVGDISARTGIPIDSIPTALEQIEEKGILKASFH